jgi:hypothetical protein
MAYPIDACPIPQRDDRRPRPRPTPLAPLAIVEVA